MTKLFANSGDPDQMLRSVASDLVTVCQLPFYGSPDYNGLMIRFLAYTESFKGINFSLKQLLLKLWF